MASITEDTYSNETLITITTPSVDEGFKPILNKILHDANRDATSLAEFVTEPIRKPKSVKFQLPNSQSRKKPEFFSRVDRAPSQLYTSTTRNVYLSGHGIIPHALGNMYQVKYSVEPKSDSYKTTN